MTDKGKEDRDLDCDCAICEAARAAENISSIIELNQCRCPVCKRAREEAARLRDVLLASTLAADAAIKDVPDEASAAGGAILVGIEMITNTTILAVNALGYLTHEAHQAYEEIGARASKTTLEEVGKALRDRGIDAQVVAFHEDGSISGIAPLDPSTLN